MLLHLLHLLLDGSVQLVLKLERLHVVNVAIVVMEISVAKQKKIEILKRRFNDILSMKRAKTTLPCQSGAQLLLRVTCGTGLILVVPVAVVPGRTVRFPRSKTYPTEVMFAILIFAYLNQETEQERPICNYQLCGM